MTSDDHTDLVANQGSRVLTVDLHKTLFSTCLEAATSLKKKFATTFFLGRGVFRPL